MLGQQICHRLPALLPWKITPLERGITLPDPLGDENDHHGYYMILQVGKNMQCIISVYISLKINNHWLRPAKKKQREGAKMILNYINLHLLLASWV